MPANPALRAALGALGDPCLTSRHCLSKRCAGGTRLQAARFGSRLCELQGAVDVSHTLHPYPAPRCMTPWS